MQGFLQVSLCELILIKKRGVRGQLRWHLSSWHLLSFQRCRISQLLLVRTFNIWGRYSSGGMSQWHICKCPNDISFCGNYQVWQVLVARLKLLIIALPGHQPVLFCLVPQVFGKRRGWRLSVYVSLLNAVETLKSPLATSDNSNTLVREWGKRYKTFLPDCPYRFWSGPFSG